MTWVAAPRQALLVTPPPTHSLPTPTARRRPDMVAREATTGASVQPYDLWAPTVYQAGAPDGNYYLFDPDVAAKPTSRPGAAPRTSESRTRPTR